MTIETLRIIFLSFLIAEFLLAIFYLRRCELHFGVYTLWGIFALVVPIMGPFIVILSKPGNCPRKRVPRSIRVRARRR